MANVAYIRVSTNKQDFDRQVKTIEDTFGKMDRTFTEKVSAKNTKDRSEYNKMLEYLREGDILHIASIDRLSRSINDFFRFIDYITENGIGLKVANTPIINIDPNREQTPDQRLITGILTSVAEWERSIMKARQKEAIEARRAQGKPIGKPRAIDKAKLEKMRELHALGVSKTRIAKEFKISRTTVIRYLRGDIVPYENEKNKEPED